MSTPKIEYPKMLYLGMVEDYMTVDHPQAEAEARADGYVDFCDLDNTPQGKALPDEIASMSLAELKKYTRDNWGWQYGNIRLENLQDRVIAKLAKNASETTRAPA